MKILLVHNFYGSAAPSGENQVFSAEKRLLEKKGYHVIKYTRHSDDILTRGAAGMLKGAVAAPWNPLSAQMVRRIIRREKPDVMHVHNTFPLISPAVFRAARKFQTATVLTLHNYRLFCAAAIPMRNEEVCTECLDQKNALPALKYGCYRNSRVATLPLAAAIALHRTIGTWRKAVDAFIALTGFQKDKLSDAGLPKERVHVKPHFYADPPEPLPWEKRRERAVFIGRLADYKGVHVLIDAWERFGPSAPELDIIGDGPSRRALENQAGRLLEKGKITFWGQLAFNTAQEKLARAKLLILPTLCFEGFPMVVREALALGVPVAASRIGSLPDLVEDRKNGILFEPGNADDLLRACQGVLKKEEKLAEMSAAARRDFEAKYTAEVNYELLMEIYRKAMAKRRKG